jgi:NitT/TauT family transport system substrate-binding protein
MKNVVSIAMLLLAGLFIASGMAAEMDIPTLKVGHVGHDHQIALYVAAEAGKDLEKRYGVYFKELKPQEVYELYDNGKLVANVQMVRVGGGAKMPAALEQGHIEVGLGGLGPVIKFVDKGSPIKVLAPLNNDGDALVLRNDFVASTWADFVKEVKSSKKPIKIGYKDPMANAYMIFIRALTEEGIRNGQEPADKEGKPVQVIMMNLQGEENALPSLEGGIVDGVVVNEPSPSIIVHKKVGKRLANLSALPPEGKWKGHPCCVVVASDAALKEKRSLIKSLLKAIAAGGDLMAADIEKGFAAEAKWTKTVPEVGRKSVMNVAYVIRPDDKWVKGVDTWIDMMISSNQFQKNLKGKSPAEIRASMFDLNLLTEAIAEMKLSPERGKKN